MSTEHQHKTVPSRKSFERELLEHRASVLAFARSLTGSLPSGEDLSQETFIRALSHWEQYEPGTQMKSWLFMICRNLFYSEKRRSWRSTSLDQVFAERVKDTTPNQEMVELFQQEFCTLAPLLGYLPGDMRDSVVAVKYLGMHYDEATIALGTELGTTKSRVSRGLEMLRDLMTSGQRNVFDLSAWATATSSVPKDHPYYPIAKAYEDIYKSLLLRPRCSLVHNSGGKVEAGSELDSLWSELLSSGELYGDEDFDDMMRHDEGSR